MRIFVTGGAGYIGSVFVEEAIKAGHTVCIFDDLSEGNKAAIHPEAQFVLGDLLNYPEIEKAVVEFQPESVIHFAGKALVGESMTQPHLYYQTNVMGGTNLLQAMVKAGCKKIVFSSTCATYGMPEKIPIDERCPQKPINPYGHSKLIFEQILKWYEQIHGVVFVALRYFNAAGASERYGECRRIETHLIPNLLKIPLGQAPHFQIFGNKYTTPDGTCIRDYIHIVDLASAHLAALNRTTSGHYNLGTGEGFSVLQIIEIARKITGHPIPVKIMEPRAGDPPRLVASANRIKMDLGWRPSFIKVSDIVQSAWNWHKNNPNGYLK